MKVTTTWANGPDGIWFVAGYDEDTFEWCGGETPSGYDLLVGAVDSAHTVRELVIEVPDEAVEVLFATPAVTGTTVPDDDRDRFRADMARQQANLATPGEGATL